MSDEEQNYGGRGRGRGRGRGYGRGRGRTLSQEQHQASDETDIDYNTANLISELPKDIILHIIDYLTLFEQPAFGKSHVHLDEIITERLTIYLNKYVETYGNVARTQHDQEFSYKTVSGTMDPYDDHQNATLSYYRESYDRHRTTYQDLFILKYQRQEQKMTKQDFYKFGELNNAHQMYVIPYEPNLTGIIIDNKDRPTETDIGTMEEYGGGRIIPDYYNITMQEQLLFYDNIEAKERDLIEFLTLLDLMKVCVCSYETGVRYEDHYDYYVYMLMADGGVWSLHLSATCEIERYTNYRE
jgi:hypothetical protein